MNYQSWTGHNDPKLGYGSMLDGFIKHKPKGVTLSDNASVNVNMQVPMSIKGWYRGQHRVLFTMWETDTMPDSFKPWFSQYDQVLVPCDFNVELFSQYHPNTTKVPLGVDLSFWRPAPKPTNTKFRFHAGGSLWMRKGLDLAVQAFKNLKLPDAELHIKAAPHAFDTPENCGPNIFLHREWMAAETQRDWYNQADCFVAPARGEGFGLMPLQAIAIGIPTIVSLSSGQREFAHLAKYTVSCGKSKAETCGKWDEPKLGELEDAMRAAYESRHSRARPEGVKEFSWAEASKKLVAAIPTGTRLTEQEWLIPEIWVEVVAQRTVNAIIGDNEVRLKQGEKTMLPPGTYEVLSASGAVKIGADR